LVLEMAQINLREEGLKRAPLMEPKLLDHQKDRILVSDLVVLVVESREAIQREILH
jgi:hypothetical protein